MPSSRGFSQLRSSALQAGSFQSEPRGKPKNTGVGSLSLLQGIFPTQVSSPGLLHCRQIHYQPSYRGSPRLSLGAANGGFSPAAVLGFLTGVTSCCRPWALERSSFSSCGLAASWHVGSQFPGQNPSVLAAFLADRVLTTGSPGKPLDTILNPLIYDKNEVVFKSEFFCFLGFFFFFLSCHGTCGILGPQPGVEAVPPALETLDQQGSLSEAVVLILK